MFKILCTSDLHLGRRSTRVPEEFDPDRHSCVDSWRRIVDAAIAERVDLVLLAGDLVDRENRYLASYGPLEKGLQRLNQADIPVIAVSGNHDFAMISEFEAVSELPNFRLLGSGGRWEKAPIFEKNGEQLQVIGWSFPEEHVDHSPLSSLSAAGLELDPALPAIGLVHADIYGSSQYAPINFNDFAATQPDLWIVGHIHEPRPEYRRFADSGPIALVPGSPQALDPGETGPHGPWIAEIKSGERPRLTHKPLSTVRYEKLRLDVSGLSADEAFAEVTKLLRETAQSAESQPGRLPDLLSCRLTLTGRTPGYAELPKRLEKLNEFSTGTARLTSRMDKLFLNVSPALDIADIAAASGPPADLAALLLSLQNGRLGDHERLLLDQAAAELSKVYAASVYAPVGEDPPDGDALRSIVAEQAEALLDALLHGKDGGDAADNRMDKAGR